MRLSVSVLLVWLTCLSGPRAQGRSPTAPDIGKTLAGVIDKVNSLETTVDALKKVNTGLSTLSPEMTHIFVYGTLKKGQPNYFRMLDKSNGRADFLGNATTVEKYPLVIAGNYSIPFLLNIPGEGQRVRGEVYSIDSQMLEFLDDFESCPTMYQRTPIKLEVNEWTRQGEGAQLAGSIIEAFVYSTTTYQPEWPKLPSYESYDSNGDHGLVYESRESRDRGASQD